MLALRISHSSWPGTRRSFRFEMDEIGDMPAGERGGVEKRLECGARLTARVGRPVERRAAEVAATDERQYVAGLRIDHDEGSLQAGLAKFRKALR